MKNNTINKKEIENFLKLQRNGGILLENLNLCTNLTPLEFLILKIILLVPLIFKIKTNH